MPTPPKPTDTPRPEEGLPPENPGATGPDDPGTSDYQNANSGRRASGHGGGSLDDTREGQGEQRERGYAFSGGGQGQEPLRSQEMDAEEDLEGRSGPFVRSGRPATEGQPGAKANEKDAATGDKTARDDAARRDR